MPTIDVTTGADLIELGDLRELLEVGEGEQPCISIYLPTSRLTSESDANRIGFKNQLKKVEQSLGLRQQQHAAHSKLLEPLLRLVDDQGFWADQREGIAVFRSPQRLMLRRLLRPITELADVANSFHLKPLIRILRESSRYQVLCVSSERVALYEGNRVSFGEVPLHPDVPRNMADALGEPSHVTKTRRTVYDLGDSEQKDDQLRRYFRRVDQAVWDHHSRRAQVPLIFAGLGEYHGFFHEASHNPNLLENGIRRDPFKAIQQRKLHELAWDVMQPVYDSQLAELRGKFAEAKAYDKAADRLENVARLAAFGKLGTLMVQDDYHVAGVLDRGTGEITWEPMHDPGVGDVVDDIAELVLRQGGDVMVLPRAQMPCVTGVAAIQRY